MNQYTNLPLGDDPQSRAEQRDVAQRAETNFQHLVQKCMNAHDNIKRPIEKFTSFTSPVVKTLAYPVTKPIEVCLIKPMKKLTLHVLKEAGLDKLFAFAYKAIGSVEKKLLLVAAQNEFMDNPLDTDPTHSRLSKDHLAHPLNQAAGLVAVKMLEHIVPAIMNAVEAPSVEEGMRQAWPVIQGAFFHPAKREKTPISSDVITAVTDYFRKNLGALKKLSKEHVKQFEHLPDAFKMSGSRPARHQHESYHGGSSSGHHPGYHAGSSFTYHQPGASFGHYPQYEAGASSGHQPHYQAEGSSGQYPSYQPGASSGHFQGPANVPWGHSPSFAETHLDDRVGGFQHLHSHAHSHGHAAMFPPAAGSPFGQPPPAQNPYSPQPGNPYGQPGNPYGQPGETWPPSI